jgi:hypothetical protein
MALNKLGINAVDVKDKRVLIRYVLNQCAAEYNTKFYSKCLVMSESDRIY